MTNSTTVVVDTSRSPHTRLRPVPVATVQLTDEFWAPRRRINRETTLPSQFRHCEETARLDNFRRLAGQKDGPFVGIYFNDSDVYKWLEAAASALADGPDPALEAMIDTAVGVIEAAQQPDGYLNTYFALERAGERWSNLRDMHELYCAGHFLQAAVAHYRATGSERLLNVARRCADCICATFGPASEGKKEQTDGHEEIELALVELYRATGDEKYLRQAQFFIDVRGRGTIGGSEYHQDHQPFRELSRMTGHAVRAVYLTSGAADLLAETGDPARRAALDRLWDNMTQTQMYVSGGIGSRYEGEAFGKDYELPNERAYTETCAAIGSVMWNWRMVQLEGDARYADVLELALYNGVLPGLSLDGQSYFYQNPLADDGTHRREPWFGCACCPPNIARLLAQLPGYFYSVSDEGAWVHLYAQGSATIALPDGRSIGVQQTTRYPWNGTVRLEIDGEGEFSLFLRVPGWCEQEVKAKVNGQAGAATGTPGAYLELRRTWSRGDVVELDLPMPPRQVECHPYAAENGGRVALLRGPLLYCLEAVDHAGCDLRDIALPSGATLTVGDQLHLTPDMVTLSAVALREPPGSNWNGQLYRTVRPRSGTDGTTVALTAIPYFAWANREPGRMQVWLRRL